MKDQIRCALVFDEYSDAGEALATWLTLEGWQAEFVTTAEEALARIENRMPDVVVMEPHLRDGSGMSVAALIRNRGGEVPWLIAVTGHLPIGDASAYEPTPFDRTLFKPVNEALLRTALADAFAHRTGRQ